MDLPSDALWRKVIKDMKDETVERAINCVSRHDDKRHGADGSEGEARAIRSKSFSGE